jgi:hypothetical protein
MKKEKIKKQDSDTDNEEVDGSLNSKKRSNKNVYHELKGSKYSHKKKIVDQS